MKITDCDKFTQAYITTALWSSTGHRFGECPVCGRSAVLCKLPEPEFKPDPVCDDPECGVRDAEPEPLDKHYGPKDISPETLAAMIADCKKFQSDNSAEIEGAIATGAVKCGPDFDEWGRAGHDFWLTRCGHSAGFWDGDWPEPFGDKLTEASKKFGNVDLYVGDDGRVHA